jgi:hypothetical protein
MADYRHGSAAAALVLVCMAGLLTGCAGESGEPEAPAAAPSTTSDPQRVTPAATDGATATPDPSGADCLRAERRAARHISLWQVIDEVVAAPTGSSAGGGDSVAKLITTAGERLREKCGGDAPPAFQRFSSDVQPIVAADRFGNPQLDEVLAAWLRWAAAVGAPDAARQEIRNLEFCRREFFPRFDASYRRSWKRTKTGKVWWIDLAFVNRTGKVLDGVMDGMAKVTGMLEDPFGWADGPEAGPGKNAILNWGGSSADFLELQPGTTKLRAAPDIDHDVHTTEDGTFRVIEMTAGLKARGEPYGCAPPCARRGDCSSSRTGRDAEPNCAPTGGASHPRAHVLAAGLCSSRCAVGQY